MRLRVPEEGTALMLSHLLPSLAWCYHIAQHSLRPLHRSQILPRLCTNRELTGLVVQPPGRVAGQDRDQCSHMHGDRPWHCPGLPTHHHQECRADPRPAWPPASTGWPAGASFAENGRETSSPEHKPAESCQFLALPTSKRRAIGEWSSLEAI